MSVSYASDEVRESSGAGMTAPLRNIALRLIYHPFHKESALSISVDNLYIDLDSMHSLALEQRMVGD